MVQALLFATTLSALTPIGGHHGVQVFNREGAATIELQAIGDIAAPPSEVEAVLLSYGEHPRIIKHLVESRVLSRQASDLYVYQHLQLPVISDRDYTLHVTWQTLPAHSFVRFAIDNSRGPGAVQKRVRMTTMTGQWELIPVDGGRATHAIYRVQIDFAGSVPRWMVRDGAAKDLPNLFQGVRQLVAERHAPVAFN